MNLSHLFSDCWIMTKRNLIKYWRIPQLLIFSTIQPIMFLLIFTYVFGGAIRVENVDYINFLMPGILVQTILFGAMITGIGLVEDVTRGMIDRFKSLPMVRASILAGRTIADLIRNFFVIILMVTVGLILGFRIENGFFNFLGGVLLISLFGFAFSWISAAIGLSVKNVETAQGAGFIWVFPLAFASSVFVPISTMPSWLRAFAEHNPVTYTVDAVRGLMLGLPIGNSVWYSLIWIVVLLALFIPLAVNRFRKIS